MNKFITEEPHSIAGGLVSSAADVKAELKADFASVKSGHEKLTKRVNALEAKSDDALDLAAAGLTRAQECEPYELVFSGFPDVPEELIPGALVKLGSSIKVAFTEECVVRVRRSGAPTTSGISSGAPLQSAAGAGSGSGSASSVRAADLYVIFKFARLRDLFLTSMRAAKGCVLDYPGVPKGTRIRCYEVLTGKAYTLFKQIRSRADPAEISVWHYNGDIKGRLKSGGRPVFLLHPSDLDALKRTERRD